MEGGGAHLGTEPKKKPSQRTQIFSALSATLAGLAHGTVTTYTSPAGPKLQNPVSPLDGDLRLSKLEYDFFSSSICLAGAVGALCFGYVMNKWGRKISLMVTAAVITIGFAMIAAGPNFPVLMIGRLLTGFGQGGALLTVPSYIGEIVAPNIRGALAACFSVMINFGNLWAYVFGAIIPSWRWFTGVNAIPALLCFVCVCFIKESPQFLLLKQKPEEARKTLQYFRGEECDINDEFDKMEKFVEELKQNRGSFKDLLLPHNFKPAAICFMVLFLDQASGIMPLLLNLRTIFTEASASVSDDLSSIITGIVQCLACVFSVFVIDKTGRKPLLIMSSAVMCLSLVALGDYFYLKEESSEWARATLGWLPLTCLVLFMSAMNGGFFPVLYVLMGELITPEARGIAGGIAIMLSSVSGFAVSITFHPMQEAMGMYGVYWFYGSMCFGALLFAVVVVPETKGKTMQQIASYFNNPAA
ncbi:solute carrier family 2, facilitated glucose transporter member 6-like isoform X1 [Macrobrachium nipponense]|uniref:solute carrier family 2, facilitated glucose transporter member 6-like isoform X1 n=1 Tax=Macrobrachium nipponense TaxID=159736 RepID=UPI0030C7B1CB